MLRLIGHSEPRGPTDGQESKRDTREDVTPYSSVSGTEMQIGQQPLRRSDDFFPRVIEEPTALWKSPISHGPPPYPPLSPTPAWRAISSTFQISLSERLTPPPPH